MYTRPLVADKRAFQVDTEGLRTFPANPVLASTFDRVSQSFQSRESQIERCRDRGREVPGNTMTKQQLFDRRQSLTVRLHDVVARSAVYVHVDEARHQDRIFQLDNPSVGWNFGFLPRRDSTDHAFGNKYEWPLDDLKRCVQLLR